MWQILISFPRGICSSLGLPLFPVLTFWFLSLYRCLWIMGTTASTAQQTVATATFENIHGNGTMEDRHSLSIHSFQTVGLHNNKAKSIITNKVAPVVITWVVSASKKSINYWPSWCLVCTPVFETPLSFNTDVAMALLLTIYCRKVVDSPAFAIASKYN